MRLVKHCLFGVMVRCNSFLPSGVHDNDVIQSRSYLLPFTSLEETIMAGDGPLSTDEAHSHFLDGSNCVCLQMCIESVQCCFVTWALHEISTPL